MSLSHIHQLQKELEQTRWVIHTDISSIEYIDEWQISRPNGDSEMTIKFSQGGNGPYGETIGNEDMGNALGFHIEGHKNLDVYFGKFSGQFQRDIKKFIVELNALPNVKRKD
jgi:hypothetical protein